jgi:hypothetical protein
MSPLPGRRSGIAVLTVELEEINPERVLIRVRTVDDVMNKDLTEERAFSTSVQTLEYLREWLEVWMRRP